MKIQLALDRMSIEQAIEVTKSVQHHVDWIEVGTSLIKEFGMVSVTRMKEAFPQKTIVADMKTIDNAAYEFQLCFDAGADVATVMGVSPIMTIETCFDIADKYNKQVMIDLLNTSEEQVQGFMQFNKAILCAHVSKDQQETSKVKQVGHSIKYIKEQITNESIQLAVAGGIDLNSLESMQEFSPSVVIIGSAITKAKNPEQTAKQLKDYMTYKGVVDHA